MIGKNHFYGKSHQKFYKEKQLITKSQRWVAFSLCDKKAQALAISDERLDMICEKSLPFNSLKSPPRLKPEPY